MRKNELSADIEDEIHGYMPEKFVLVYYELVRRGYRGMKDSLAGAADRVGGGDGSGPGGRGSEGAVIVSEDALARKRRIDRVLRQLAREDTLGAKKDAPKCARCKRFMQPDWKFCANCGEMAGSGGADEMRKDRAVS